jgi:hypothetical protein
MVLPQLRQPLVALALIAQWVSVVVVQWRQLVQAELLQGMALVEAEESGQRPKLVEQEPQVPL